jgi:lipoprotein-releasing system ATP-binding protein
MRVSVNNLSMRFHDGEEEVEVFSGLSLEVPSGSSLAVVGESGSGKTTLLYLMGGLEKPTGGQVLIGDTEITRLAGDALSGFRGEQIGFVFQFHNLLPEFSALENVAMPLRIGGVPTKQAEVRAGELLRQVGLSHRLTHRPGALSGGEQQRVAIARALSRDPRVLLADEPTGNLDQRSGGQVKELLLQMQQERGLTLVVVTHSRELAGELSKVFDMGTKELRG